jgi:predicted DNA binding protein
MKDMIRRADEDEIETICASLKDSVAVFIRDWLFESNQRNRSEYQLSSAECEIIMDYFVEGKNIFRPVSARLRRPYETSINQENEPNWITIKLTINILKTVVRAYVRGYLDSMGKIICPEARKKIEAIFDICQKKMAVH